MHLKYVIILKIMQFEINYATSSTYIQSYKCTSYFDEINKAKLNANQINDNIQELSEIYAMIAVSTMISYNIMWFSSRHINAKFPESPLSGDPNKTW